MKRRQFLQSVTAALGAATFVAAPAVWSPARAQSREETLLIVSENGPNNLDIQGVGTNVPGYEASWNCYDRLITHEMKTLPDGTQYYDRDKFEPELAEDMAIGDMSVTFKLKKNATFQDGTPVTAKDVKWSLDRAVTVGGFPTFQMKAGSLIKNPNSSSSSTTTPSASISLRKDRLTIPDLAVIVPCIINSAAGQEERDRRGSLGPGIHQAATPPAAAPTRSRVGRPAPRSCSSATRPGKAGRLPKIEAHHLAHGPRRRQPPRIAGARRRRRLLRPAEQGFRRAQEGRASSRSSRRPISNGIQYIGMNVKNPPFNNVKVRQAVAYAIPYQKIMDAVLFGLAKPMFGAPAERADDRSPGRSRTAYNTDIAKAKQLMAEAGYPNGFETTISFDLGLRRRQRAARVLTQESLAQIGIKTDDQQGPRRQLAHRAQQEDDAALHQRLLAAGSTIRNISSSGAITGRMRSSTR